MSDYESAVWAAVAAAGVAALAGLVAVVLLLRFRRAASRDLGQLGRRGANAEALLGELDQALGRLTPPAPGLEATLALQAAPDLDEALAAALRAACGLLEADAALISMERPREEPVIASFGLAGHETTGELLGLPADAGGARAVRLDYLYSEDRASTDAFRITAGLAVPLLALDGRQAGVLALFWRRGRTPAGEETIERFEELARLFGPPLENALRYAEARRLADRDVVTGLQNRRYFHERLDREVARARRYGRRLSLLVFDTSAMESPYTLAEAGERILAVARASDVACHLGNGVFAVILPESEGTEAGRLLRRLQFTIGARVDSPGERLRLHASAAELLPDEDAVEFAARANRLLSREIAAEFERPAAAG